MRTKKNLTFAPIHPGEILQDAIDGAKITQSTLAEHIGLPQSTINDICRGRRGISVEMAARLGRAFGSSTEFWYNLQKNYELDSFDEEKFSSIDKIAA
jgi:antitoxin HigA-1